VTISDQTLTELELTDIEADCEFGAMSGECGYQHVEDAVAVILKLTKEVRRLREENARLNRVIERYVR
jgi:cell division protein FtsB